MVVWFKLEDGRAIRLVDHWSPAMFIGANNLSDLDVPLNILGPDIARVGVVGKRERITDHTTSDVLEVRVKDARKLQQVGGRLERLGPFGSYRLYNVDVPPAQSYLYEHDIFPLAYCEVTQSGGRLNWTLKDDVWAYDYTVPNLRKIELDVQVAKEGKLARFSDKIVAITLKSDSGLIEIRGPTEAEQIVRLVEAIEAADPDFILTRDGDTFLFPYLIKRAETNGVGGQLRLNRDRTTLKRPTKDGTSYFSYGRIHYKPSAMKLNGRIHIDLNTSFAYSEAGFEGLFELTRVCRMPLQTSSRASIGKALSSLQFYHASKLGLLVPWKPALSESFKNRNELLTADRGGFIFEPKAGVHENVGELDFSALYPNIMYRKNISAETVRCSCCPDSKNRVPELGWNVCERRKGIVPLAIKIIIEKRLHYKQLKSATEGGDYSRYNARQAALKWLGVTTFGYLGFNNAKFGRIDAHIAVCAWDREVLVNAARIAERSGFEVVHGIVDSLWIKKEGAGRDDFLRLKSEIEEDTGFATSFEGVYKWVVFLPSKVDPATPVLNRYFGAYWNGELKVRGVEARRHDTPAEFKRCQMRMLAILAEADSLMEVKAKVPECVQLFIREAQAIERHEVPVTELAFTTNLSKAPEEYATMTIQHAAIKQLVREGAQIHAGEGIRYIITDYKGRDSKRAAPLDTIAGLSKYDANRYIELLAATCASVLEPFDGRCTGAGLHGMYESGKHGSVV